MFVLFFGQIEIFSTPGQGLESLPTVWTCIFSSKKSQFVDRCGEFFSRSYVCINRSAVANSKKKKKRKNTQGKGGENEDFVFFHCKYLLIYGICIDVEMYFILSVQHTLLEHIQLFYYYTIIFTVERKKEREEQ